jgi:prolipoprotein diacylglyceryltransferase
MQQIIADFGTLKLFCLEIPLRVYGYGLMLVLGFLVAIGLAQWRGRRMGEDPEHVAYCGLLALIGGIVGSRVAYIIEHWRDQFAPAPRPLAEVFNITSGGLIYYGGVILATLLVLSYLALKRLPIRRFLDIVAPSLMIGLAFGRAGCTLNGCCYGAQCRHDWALGMRFPMFSKPLLKADGRDHPFSQYMEGPSPVYTDQLRRVRIEPPPELVSRYASGKVLVDGALRNRQWVHAPRYLHGALRSDQTAVWADPNAAPEARKAFAALAGPDGLVDEAEWQRGLAEGGLLRGSEHWDEAAFFDRDASGRLTFEEAYAYLSARRRYYDADADGVLSADERAAANRELQADQFALASAARSLPVKPAQILGLINALLLAGILTVFLRLRKREGQVFAVLVMLYPITRFVLESVRDDNAHDLARGVLTHNQVTSLVLLAMGMLMWWMFRRLPASAGPAAAERIAAAARRGRNAR